MSELCVKSQQTVCHNGWLSGGLRSLKSCCDATLSRPEELLFRVRQWCASVEGIQPVTRSEWCRCSKYNASQMGVFSQKWNLTPPQQTQV